jgi:hypothetical protein
MPSCSIRAWFIATALSIEPASTSVEQPIRASRGRLSNAIVSRHAASISARYWLAMCPANEPARSGPSSSAPVRRPASPAAYTQAADEQRREVAVELFPLAVERVGAREHQSRASVAIVERQLLRDGAAVRVPKHRS